MKKKLNKKLIISQTLIVIALIITTIVIINISSSKASTDTTSLLKDQEIDNLEFVNATLENNKLKVVVHNLEESAYSLKTIDVSFLDNDSNTITTIRGYIGNNIEAESMKQLVVQTDADLAKATSIKYTINK